MIEKGSVLRLHEKGLYTVGDFRITISEESGNYVAQLMMTGDDGVEYWYPVEMVMELIRNSKLYPHGQEDIMGWLHKKLAEKRQGTGLNRGDWKFRLRLKEHPVTIIDRDLKNANFDTVTAACDCCGTKCPETTRCGTGHWEKEMARLNALDKGWSEKPWGSMRVLVCPTCQQHDTNRQLAMFKWRDIRTGRRVVMTEAQLEALVSHLMTVNGEENELANRLASEPNPNRVGTLDSLVVFIRY